MMSARDDSSSSSEDENTERIKEALWSFGAESVMKHEDGGKHTHSKRLKVCDHEHDGNELQTTPEFRSHVAKKLGVMLDSVICEVFSESPDCKSAACEDTQDEDEGFRLFSTSLPGNWREEPKENPPPKRRPIPSSSDSDSEMESRLREAAVSVSDLLRSSSTEKRQEEERTERTDAGARDKESAEPKKKKKKNKKKRKAVTEGNEDETLAQDHSTENNTLKKRKKKEKKMNE